MRNPSRAEELFARFLADQDAADAPSFERWIQAHPALDAELRRLHARWLEFHPLLDRLTASPDGPDPETGELLRRLAERGAGARLDVKDEIGSGGMGRVFRAWDPELERDLALKVARAPSADGDGTRARRRTELFLHEARITGRLQHPGVVALHELGVDAEGRVFYTMPLIEGNDLEHVFARVHADPGESGGRIRVLGHLQRVCETMAYAHASGVVHGDLKPANVRIGRYGEVTVMDWGLARRVGEEPADHPSVDVPERAGPGRVSALRSRVGGTPAYLAPERILDSSAPPDPRGDVYAVGAMLYRLLTGRLPYQDEIARGGQLDELRAAVRRPPAPVREAAPDVPAELASICARAMAPLPERYAGIAELGDDLSAFLEGRVVRAHATGTWVELKKWVARNRGTAAALCALALSLAIGLAVSSLLFLSARREKERVLRLADLRRHGELVAEAGRLWPAVPARAEAYADWLGRAEELVGRLDLHRATLAALRTGGRRTREAGWELGDDEVQWHHDSLANLVDEVERFGRPETGLVADVRLRLDFARTIEERSRDGEAARAAWAEATRSIADTRSSPAYDGLRLAPQLGLLPVGRDPGSGLWEFAHLESGVPPQRDADDRLQLAPESGIVLVLLPGGTFLQGAQSADPAAPGYAPAAFANEGPPHAVTLAPFFLSKYELTQAQWSRLAGSNPSTIHPGTEVAGSPPVTLLHPVETVGRGECAEVLRQRDLELPTEAQWEYGARAGTEAPWWTGADPRSLQDAANLADRTVLRAGGEWPQIESWLDDGFHRHAPVDALRPNPFGLVHVHGNVWEWCRDDFAPYELGARPGDGLRSAPEPGMPVGRGGGYVNDADYSRASVRDGRPDAPHLLFGVRPARSVR